jgi:uncharacterized integral membrane protein
MELTVLWPLLVIQLVLMVVALIDLYRRDVSQIAFGNKWPWVLIILLLNVIGPIIYLIVGRKH